MKKILMLFLLISLANISITSADFSVTQTDVNQIVKKIIVLMEDKDFNKIYFYTSNLDSYADKKGISEQTKKLALEASKKLKQLYSRNSGSNILRLNENMTNVDINKILEKNKSAIAEKDNVFIFRGNKNLPLELVKYTTSKLKKINPKIRILIDEEGGYVNRIVIFDTKNTFSTYLKSDTSLRFKYEVLMPETKEAIQRAFKNRANFISMKTIGIIFDKLPNNKEKANFLDFMTYFRLYTLKNVGINTHGIDCDLDYGNPGISGYERSFSKSREDYILLGKYFVKNARILGMSLYLKHFPGHGDGGIDTHEGILIYSDKNKNYLEDNLSVFKNILNEAKKEGVEIGIMTGHIVFPKTFEKEFNEVLEGADYILTDDLGMGGFEKASKTDFPGKIFSTNLILKLPNVVQVYTTKSQIK